MYEKPRLERYGTFLELSRLAADPEKAARKHTIPPVLPRKLPIPPNGMEHEEGHPKSEARRDP
jgi:hypothetical protein